MRCVWRGGEGGQGVEGCKLFSWRASSELKGRSIPYLSWSGNNHLYVPYVLVLYCLVMSLMSIL